MQKNNPLKKYLIVWTIPKRRSHAPRRSLRPWAESFLVLRRARGRGRPRSMADGSAQRRRAGNFEIPGSFACLFIYFSRTQRTIMAVSGTDPPALTFPVVVFVENIR